MLSTTQLEPPPSLTPSAPVPDATTSGKAIASLVCGILNFFPFFVIAIVLGHISLSEIRKSAGRLKGEGLAIAGLVLGYLGIVAIPLILIVAAIAIPNLLRAKIAANESSAMHSVRALGAAEVTYRIQHGDTGFTCKLSDLSSMGVADPSLMSGQKHGYAFAIQNCKADTSGAIVSFQVIATPLTYGSTGSRTFCADESGTIRSARSGSAEDCLNQEEYIQ